MKKSSTLFVAVIASLLIMLSSASIAFADVVKGNADHTGNFASDLPIGTVTIDTTNMGPTNPNMQFSSTNPEIVLDSTTEDAINHPSVAWRPNAEGDTTTPTLNIGESKTLDGEVTLTWPGIATLQDGSTADVVMTISNISFSAPYRGTNPNFRDGTLVGPLRFFWTAKNNGQTYLGPRGNLGGTGMQATVNVKVVGAPAGATVLFSTNDLDVVDHKHNRQYDESFEVVGGAVSDIVVPNDHNLNIEGDKLSAIAGDNNTYKTGFIVLADAKEGITLTWRGAGRAMGTSLFTGNISHHIDSTSGKGGSIKTTTTGKVGEGDELGPVRADVPDGKDVSYLLEPDKGYKLDTIKVDGKEVDPDDPSTWLDFIEITKDENGNPVVTFKDNADNHTIDVTWERVYTVTFENGDHGTSTGGNQTDVSAGEYPKGGNTVTPSKGYEFSGTYTYVITHEDGTTETGETDDPTSVEVTGDIVFTPVYDPIVTATTGKGGSISNPGDTAVSSGSSKTYTFTPDEGYTVGTVTVNGKEVTPTKNDDGTWSYTLENITEPTAIDVQWKKTYTVTFADGDNGTSAGGNQTNVPAGDNPAGGNTVTPNAGYKFSGTYKYVITHEDGTTEEGETDDPTSVEVTGDIVFTPVYDPIVTAKSGSGGSISDPGDTAVSSGSSKTYTFTPEKGYEPDTVVVNGQEVTPTKNDDGTWSYTLEKVTSPTTIEVTWKKTQIPVKFVDPISGETINSQSVDYGDSAKEPTPPVHSGYTFKGWDTVFDNITGETTVVAIYEPNKYTIKYDANGGSGTMDDEEFSGSDEQMMSKDNKFTKDDSKFTGFKAYITDPETGKETPLTDDNGEPLIFESAEDLKEYFDGKPSGTSIRLEAQWEPISPSPANPQPTDQDQPTPPSDDPIVTATTGEGGSISDPGDTTVSSGSSKTYIFTPEKGYEPDTVVVDGKEVTPTKNDDGTWSHTLENITDSTAIEVTWKKIQIPVTFVDPISGETINSQSVDYGDSAKEPTPPVHSGYTFKGWDTVFDNITGETTIVAIYEPNKYTLKYDANGGSGTMDPQNFTGADAEAISKANEFTRDGYTFTGFKAELPDGSFLKDENGNDLVFNSTEDFIAYLRALNDGAEITLVAQWEPKLTPTPENPDSSPAKTYWVTYVDPDGTTVYLAKTTQNVGSPEPSAPANPTKNGFTFDGWNRTVDADGNITYTAKWKPVSSSSANVQPTSPSQSAPIQTARTQSVSTQSAPRTESKHAVPETGDSINIIVWVSLLGLSMLSIAGVKRKRRQS